MRRAQVASAALAWAAAVLLTWGCRPTDPTPESTADCKAARVCEEQGRCTMDYNTRKCVVGSNEDCAASKICQKERLCYKVGEVCGSSNSE